MSEATRAFRPHHSMQSPVPPCNSDQIGHELLPGDAVQFDPMGSSDSAHIAAQVLLRSHTLGQGLALALTDPRRNRFGKKAEICLRVSELCEAACSDDEPIHLGMGKLLALGIVRWKQKPGPCVEAEWWVPAAPECWIQGLAETLRRGRRKNSGEVGGKTAERLAEKQRHADAKKKNNKASESTSTSTSTQQVQTDAGGGARAWEAAVKTLLGAGITPGQPERLLRRVMTAPELAMEFAGVPVDLIAEAFVRVAQRRNKSSGGDLGAMVASAMRTGWEGKVAAYARDLQRIRKASAAPITSTRESPPQKVQVFRPAAKSAATLKFLEPARAPEEQQETLPVVEQTEEGRALLDLVWEAYSALIGIKSEPDWWRSISVQAGCLVVSVEEWLVPDLVSAAASCGASVRFLSMQSNAVVVA